MSKNYFKKIDENKNHYFSSEDTFKYKRNSPQPKITNPVGGNF